MGDLTRQCGPPVLASQLHIYGLAFVRSVWVRTLK